MRRLLSLLCLFLALPATAEIIWKSGFETGDRREWSSAQVVSGEPERLKVVGDVAREGKRSLKATVVYGDKPIIASGNRNELIKMTREEPGSEYWYRWSVRFGSTFPSEKTWQLFTQWHHEGNNGSPPVEFYVYGEEVRLNIGGNPGRIVWRTALKRGVWYDFVFRVRWSPDPKVGLVELYLNGKQVLKPLSIATQFQGMRNYLKAGLYRNDSIKTTAHLYLDDFMIATTQADVMPLPTPPPAPEKDAGTTGPVDAGAPQKSDAGMTTKADAGVASRPDAGLPAQDGGTTTQASEADAGVRTDDAVVAPAPLVRDAGVAHAPAPERKGGCSASGGDSLVGGMLLTLAAIRIGHWRTRRRKVATPSVDG